MNTTKRSGLTGVENKLVIISGEESMGKYQCGWEVQVSLRDILYNIGNIPIFYNNCKWSLNFKNCMNILRNSKNIFIHNE